MKLRDRKVRLALLVGLVVLALYAVWRDNRPPPECEPGRQVERDAAGKVVRITNKICFQ